VEKLIRKKSHVSEDSMYYTHADDVFDVIKKAHIATGHGGRDKMTKALSLKYANITRGHFTVQIFMRRLSKKEETQGN
jgi:hypothetical protein